MVIAVERPDESKCPFTHIAGVGRTNRDWWPSQLRLELLHQHSAKSDPLGKGFDYAKEKFVKDFVTAWSKVMNLDRF